MSQEHDNPAERLSLADQLLAKGDLSAAEEMLNALLKEAPCSQDVVSRLMELHLNRGDRSGAIRLYQELAGCMQKEHATTPSPSLGKMLQQGCGS